MCSVLHINTIHTHACMYVYAKRYKTINHLKDNNDTINSMNNIKCEGRAG